jgi:hypothetical protein
MFAISLVKICTLTPIKLEPPFQQTQLVVLVLFVPSASSPSGNFASTRSRLPEARSVGLVDYPLTIRTGELREGFRHLHSIPTSDLRLLTSAMFAPQFLADKTERILDFGYCLLRMNITSDR